MNNIQKQSQRVRKLFQLFYFLTPIVVIFYWLALDTTYDILGAMNLFNITADITNFTQSPLTTTTRLFGMTASLMLYSIIMYALSVLIQLFKNYENNEIFSLKNSHHYQHLSYCIFYWVVGSIIHNTLISLILSYNNPPGERMIMISFAGMDFVMLLLGMAVLIISWVMKEAYLLADENLHTI